MVEIPADKTNSGALVQKYESGIKGFFKDDYDVEAFKKLSSIQEKLGFVWKSKSMQVNRRLVFNNTEDSFPSGFP